MSGLVSVVIPVFNGEKYLSQTLESIRRQTYTNIEVLMVDDASTDSSPLILDRYAESDKRFKVFSKENGGMVPKTLNFVLPHIKGEYFYYSSQDDLFSEDLVESMVKKQKESNADMVLPDMEFYLEGGIKNKSIVGLNSNREVELSGKQALIESLNWNIHGFALFKMKLLKGERFPEDAFDSDEFITRKLFLKSNKVVFSKGVFFYRQDNYGAITKTFSAKNFFVLNTTKRLYDLLIQNKIPRKYIFSIQDELIKKHFMFSAISEVYSFNTKTEKEKIQSYLSVFKKNVLTNAFISKNLSVALKTLNFKYLILFFVYRFPWLLSALKPVFYRYVTMKFRRKTNEK